MKKAVIQITNLDKVIGKKMLLQDLSLEIMEGECAVLLGPNGTGKSTLLNIIARLDKPDCGKVKVATERKQDLSYIMQNYRETLIPWRTVEKNITLPLEIGKLPTQLIQTKLNQMLDFFEISHLPLPLSKYPYQLSGGQRQIVAMLRALITQPKILLADEAFSALDFQTTLIIRRAFYKWIKLHRTTALIISHNLDETLYLSDTIHILSKNPSNIEKSIKTNLTEPRSNTTIHSQEFLKIKQITLDSFLKAAA